MQTSLTPPPPAPNQEIMFEKFGVPAEFMSKDAVLACFSIGRTTASLVDVGGDSAVVTPVYDG